MAGETFSCWSTQVNKDALFVTAILLLSIARLSERLVQTIPKRRTRPNFSHLSFPSLLVFSSNLILLLSPWQIIRTRDRLSPRLIETKVPGFDIFWSMTVKKLNVISINFLYGQRFFACTCMIFDTSLDYWKRKNEYIQKKTLLNF